jgi:hypothetical protein
MLETFEFFNTISQLTDLQQQLNDVDNFKKCYDLVSKLNRADDPSEKIRIVDDLIRHTPSGAHDALSALYHIRAICEEEVERMKELEKD